MKKHVFYLMLDAALCATRSVMAMEESEGENGRRPVNVVQSYRALRAAANTAPDFDLVRYVVIASGHEAQWDALIPDGKTAIVTRLVQRAQEN